MAVAGASRTDVLVYSGEGAGARSVQSAVQHLQATLRLSAPGRPPLKVATLSTAELLRGAWRQRCLLLVMPGGADLPYCRHLNGAGNRLIAGFVEDTGAYLGLCAGAYYACARVEFEVGSRLEVAGERELRFCSGTACGAVTPGFNYKSEAGAAAVQLTFLPPSGGDSAQLDPLACRGAQLSDSCCDYSNGGPALLPPAGCSFEDDPDVAVLARYRGGGVAALAARVGGGRAVLCGTHPELHPDWLAAACDANELVASGACEPAEAAGLAAATATVKQQLANSQNGRLRLWRLLVTAAGLGQYLLQRNFDSSQAAPVF